MALDAEIQQLQANPLFAQFEAEALRLIVFSSDTRVLRPDDTIFREGDISDGGYFLVSGSVVMATGEREDLVAPGSVIGEAALFAETRRPATATARETAVIRRIPRHLMRRVLSAYPGVAARVSTYLQQRIRSVGEDLARVDARLPEEDEG
jgi:CRP-like cAMP-binding protein